MKKGHRKNPPKKHPKQAEKGPRAPQTKGQKRAPQKRARGSLIFWGGGGCSGTFFWVDPFLEPCFLGLVFFVLASAGNLKEGPTPPPPPFIIIKGTKKGPPQKKKKAEKRPPTPFPPKKKEKAPEQKRPLKKTRKAPKKEGSKARQSKRGSKPHRRNAEINPPIT